MYEQSLAYLTSSYYQQDHLVNGIVPATQGGWPAGSFSLIGPFASCRQGDCGYAVQIAHYVLMHYNVIHVQPRKATPPTPHPLMPRSTLTKVVAILPVRGAGRISSPRQPASRSLHRRCVEVYCVYLGTRWHTSGLHCLVLAPPSPAPLTKSVGSAPDFLTSSTQPLGHARTPNCST